MTNNTPSTITVSSDALSRSEKWMRQRDALLACTPSILEVTSQEDLEGCSKLQNAIRAHLKALDSERKKITAPLDAMKKDIMAQEKALAKPLESEQRRLQTLSSAYATRLAAEAEAERRRQATELERQRQAAAEAEALTREIFGDEAVDDEPKPIEAPPPPPPPDRPRVEGARVVKRWSYEITDPRLIPREYLSVNEPAIRAHIQFATKTGSDPAIPGVRFQARMSVE